MFHNDFIVICVFVCCCIEHNFLLFRQCSAKHQIFNSTGNKCNIFFFFIFDCPLLLSLSLMRFRFMFYDFWIYSTNEKKNKQQNYYFKY